MSGEAGVRAGRGDLLGRLHRVAELAEGVAAERSRTFGKKSLLLLLDVVAHVLDQHGDLGVEPLVGGVHVVELGRAPT